MKITITTSRLNEALKKVSGITNGKSALAILGNVKVEVVGNKVKLTTTDTNITLMAEAECDGVKDGGMTTVPMKTFTSVVSALPVGLATIESDAKDRMRISLGNSVFRIGGLSAKDFPSPPSDDNSVRYVVKATALKELIRKTSYAMESEDGTRKTLQGTLLDFNNGSLKAVATDGRRLATATQANVSEEGCDAQYIIPSAAIPMISRVLGGDSDVIIHAAKSQICFECGNATVYTKLVDGIYPNYKQVIPTDLPLSAKIDRSALIESLYRVMVMSSDSPQTKLSISTGQMEVDVVENDQCDAHDMIPIKYDGNDIALIFNLKYLIDALRAINSDEIELSFLKTEGGPAVIRAEGEDFLALVMQLRLH